MTREIGSKTSQLATELTIQNASPFSRATFQQDNTPATPNRRYEGLH